MCGSVYLDAGHARWRSTGEMANRPPGFAGRVAVVRSARQRVRIGDHADLRDGLNPRHRLHIDMRPDRDGLCGGSTAPERERDRGDSRQRGGLGSGSQLTVDCDTDEERRDHRPDAYRGRRHHRAVGHRGSSGGPPPSRMTPNVTIGGGPWRRPVHVVDRCSVELTDRPAAAIRRPRAGREADVMTTSTNPILLPADGT
jgi:hypothetical protein